MSSFLAHEAWFRDALALYVDEGEPHTRKKQRTNAALPVQHQAAVDVENQGDTVHPSPAARPLTVSVPATPQVPKTASSAQISAFEEIWTRGIPPQAEHVNDSADVAPASDEHAHRGVSGGNEGNNSRGEVRCENQRLEEVCAYSGV